MLFRSMPPRCRSHTCQFMRLWIFLKEYSAGARIDSVSNCSIGTHVMTDRSGFSEGATKPTGVGTGPGSPVTKQILDLYGGTIDIRPASNGGAWVTLMLKAENGG